MDKLLILSGKGGTGKTTVAASFIKLSQAEAFADCDVDAPNLHLVINAEGKEEKDDYYGLQRAEVESNVCIGCGECEEACRFGAISIDEGKATVDKFACEGCKLCTLICPVDAITMVPFKLGETMIYKGDRVFSTAKLKTGGGSTGKLVSEVKRRMFLSSVGAKTAIIDGSPGIGCPVIASMNGVSLILVVAEPSVSGISDMKRVIDTAKQNNIPVCVCINKWDANPNKTQEIIEYCSNSEIILTGKIPFDKAVQDAINSGLTPVEVECAAGSAIKDIYKNTFEILKGKRS